MDWLPSSKDNRRKLTDFLFAAAQRPTRNSSNYFLTTPKTQRNSEKLNSKRKRNVVVVTNVPLRRIIERFCKCLQIVGRSFNHHLCDARECVSDPIRKTIVKCRKSSVDGQWWWSGHHTDDTQRWDNNEIDSSSRKFLVYWYWTSADTLDVSGKINSHTMQEHRRRSSAAASSEQSSSWSLRFNKFVLCALGTNNRRRLCDSI